MLHLLALNGSTRPGGTTEAVLRFAAQVADEAGARLTVLNLREKHVLPCGACGNCNWRKAECEVQDDVRAIVDEMLAADGIIYATPVHGFGMASPMQTFIERAGVGHLRFERPLADKVGGAIVVGRRYNHGAVHAQLVNNLLLNRLVLVGSGFPALVHAGGPDEIERDQEGLQAVRQLVDRMVRFLLESGSTGRPSRSDFIELAPSKRRREHLR